MVGHSTPAKTAPTIRVNTIAPPSTAALDGPNAVAYLRFIPVDGLGLGLGLESNGTRKPFAETCVCVCVCVCVTVVQKWVDVSVSVRASVCDRRLEVRVGVSAG